MKAEADHSTETLWKELSRDLKRFINARIHRPDLAEDILQEVFIKIHAHMEDLKNPDRIKGWVFQIARNAIIDYYRSRKITLEIPPNLADEKMIEIEASPHQKFSVGLRGLVEALPEKYKQALLLTEFEGLNQRELAGKLGLSLSGAKSRVQRGRALVKDQLMRCCHFQFDRYGTIIDYHPITCCCCSLHNKK